MVRLKGYPRQFDEEVKLFQSVCDMELIFTDFINEIGRAKNDKTIINDLVKGHRKKFGDKFYENAEQNSLFQIKETIDEKLAKIKDNQQNISDLFDDMIKKIEGYRDHCRSRSIACLNEAFDLSPTLYAEVLAFTERLSFYETNNEYGPLKLGENISKLSISLRIHKNKLNDTEIDQKVNNIIDGLNKAKHLLYLRCNKSCHEMLLVVEKFNTQLDSFLMNVSGKTKEDANTFISEGKKIITQARKNEALTVHRHIFMEGVRQCFRFFGAEGPRTDRIIKVGKLGDSIKGFEDLIKSEVFDSNDDKSEKRHQPLRGG